MPCSMVVCMDFTSLVIENMYQILSFISVYCFYIEILFIYRTSNDKINDIYIRYQVLCASSTFQDTHTHKYVHNYVRRRRNKLYTGNMLCAIIKTTYESERVYFV